MGVTIDELRARLPEHIRSDNGPEFTADAMRLWLSLLEVKTLYIEAGAHGITAISRASTTSSATNCTIASSLILSTRLTRTSHHIVGLAFLGVLGWSGEALAEAVGTPEAYGSPEVSGSRRFLELSRAIGMYTERGAIGTCTQGPLAETRNGSTAQKNRSYHDEIGMDLPAPAQPG